MWKLVANELNVIRSAIHEKARIKAETFLLNMKTTMAVVVDGVVERLKQEKISQSPITTNDKRSRKISHQIKIKFLSLVIKRNIKNRNKQS